MKLCRFNRDRIGVIDADTVHDVTSLFDTKPTWPLPPGDWIVRQLAARLPEIRQRYRAAPAVPLGSVRLESPVANPGKIIGAPINYKAHLAEAQADPKVSHGRTLTSIDQYGLFLKAGSALIGPSDEVRLRFSERRNDHEVELAAIIGKEASNVGRDRALDYVAGYAIGLDMTVRGPEFPTFRKSVDTYAVLGPWMVTADEIADPNNLALGIKVNGETRQSSSTKYLIFDVQRLVEYASQFYTLHPGDVIMTGTPEGVSQVYPGDVMDCFVERVGEMRVAIAKAWAAAR